MKTRASLVVFVVSLFAGSPVVIASPQTVQTEAHVRGTIVDPSGAGIGGVSIGMQLASEAKGQIWSTKSGANGNYGMSVPPGRYRVRFSRDAFVPHEFLLELIAGESRTLDLQLELESLSSSVIVTAETQPIQEQQTTAAVEAMTRRDIDARQSVTLPDLLLFSPGVAIGHTGSNGGTASLFLDGGNSNFTKVLFDGAPINPPGGAVDFSILTLDNVDKVEVVHGAESAIYGTDAVSGVVQMFSHRGATRVPSLNVFAEGGGFSSGRGGAQFSGVFGGFDYSLGAGYLQTDGQVSNNDFLERTLSGNFGYRLNDTNQIRLSLRSSSSGAGIPGQVVFEPPSQHQRYNQRLFSANARWDFVSGTRWHHQIMGSESFTQQHSFNPEQSFYATDPFAFCPQTSTNAIATAEFCDFTFDSHYSYNRAGFSAQSSYLIRNLGLTAGYQYEVENASIYFLEQPHARRNNQGGYLDLRFAPIPRITVNAGVRAEDNDYFGTRVVPRVGLSAAIRYGSGFWGDTRYRAFYGEGIKEPRFDQNYGTDPCDPGNLSLKPESSKNWSTGFEQKLAKDRIRVSADYFSSRFYDMVSFTFCAPGEACPVAPPAGCPFGYGTYFNTDLARARGTHIALEVHAAKWLFVSGNYTYDDSLVIQAPNASDPALVPGNRLIRRPPHSGSISFTTTFRRFNAVFAGYFTGQRTDSDFLGLRLTRNPGYARFDVSTAYELARGVSVYARATNLFDKRYQDALGYPALGRQAIIGVRYQFAGRN